MIWMCTRPIAMLNTQKKILLLLLLNYLNSTDSQLELQSNDCGCVIYECTVSGEGAIIWSGSAFECTSTNNELVFFGADLGYSVCNNGAVKARRVNYTSQLIITDRYLSGSKIQRIHDDGTNSMVIHNVSVPIIAEPMHVLATRPRLVNVSTQRLTFEWIWSGTLQCSSVYYEISSAGCGMCPAYALTNNNYITCEGVRINVKGFSVCTISVKVISCDRYLLNEYTKDVILKVPIIAKLDVIPTYSIKKDSQLLEISTNFMDSMTSFDFSEEIDGSTDFYTIDYTDSTLGMLCVSVKILAAACLHGICEHVLKRASLAMACPSLSTLVVTVFGTNRLGAGQPLNSTIIEFTNNFVELSIHQQNSTAVCKFPKWRNGTKLKCTINFRFNCNENYNVSSDYSFMITSQPVDADSVILRIEDSQRLSPGEYCLVVTATNGSVMAILTGSFIVTGDNLSPDFIIGVLNFGVSIGSLGLIIIVVTVCLVAMTVALIRIRRITVTETAVETTDDVYEDISAEPHTIKTECNEAYNYVMKH